MGTFAPLLADSLKGFFNNFLSFYVCKGFQAPTHTPEGIKGKKGIKADRARTAQKGVTTFRTFIPFIPALCVPEGVCRQSCSPGIDVPCEEGARGSRVLPTTLGYGAGRPRVFASGCGSVVLTLRLTRGVGDEDGHG